MLRFMNWLFAKWDYQLVPVHKGERMLVGPHLVEMSQKLEKVVRHFDRFEFLHGGAKKRQALAEAKKMFPKERTHDVELALDLALKVHRGSRW